jgi:hypothetical protein
MTVFINVDSADDHQRNCPAELREQTVCMAVRLKEGIPIILDSDASSVPRE